MANGNTVTITGNASNDAQLKSTGSQVVTTFGVAVNRRWQNRQTNEWEEAVSFFDVTAWQKLAENAAASIKKGTRVVVTGRLDQRSWETSDGEKRTKVEIVALKYLMVSLDKKSTSQGHVVYGSSPGSVPSGPPADYDQEPF